MFVQEFFSDTGDDHNNTAVNVVPFKATLAQHNLQLVRGNTHTLQINLGFLCNQVCRHCHLNAGPDRKENMDAATVAALVAYAARKIAAAPGAQTDHALEASAGSCRDIAAGEQVSSDMAGRAMIS